MVVVVGVVGMVVRLRWDVGWCLFGLEDEVVGFDVRSLLKMLKVWRIGIGETLAGRYKKC